MATSTARLKVGVFGASGYTGTELVQCLLRHPAVRLEVLGSTTHAGAFVADVIPELLGLSKLRFSPCATQATQGLDLLFLALPHGASMALVPTLEPNLKVIDLSGDYRLQDLSAFQHYYGMPHTDAKGLSQFIYGLPELSRAGLAGALRVSNPGCFATAVSLALAPLLQHGLSAGPLWVSAITGSSGAGAKPGASTHHPHRAEAFSAYKIFSHQHQPEIMQTLQRAAPKWDDKLCFQAHSAPLVRGIHISAFCSLRPDINADSLSAAFADSYSQEPLIRLRTKPVDVKWVRGTPFTDIHWAVQGQQAMIFAAMDNLQKGAATQAIQNMNLSLGLPETLGILPEEGTL